LATVSADLVCRTGAASCHAERRGARSSARRSVSSGDRLPHQVFSFSAAIVALGFFCQGPGVLRMNLSRRELGKLDPIGSLLRNWGMPMVVFEPMACFSRS
jgi:hypothetical protein